jgi:alanyl-tRNA synthetase
MKKVLLTLAIVVAALAYCSAAYAEAGGGDRPQRPEGFERGGKQAPGALDPFALAPSEEYKAEVKRHGEEARKIMEEFRAIGQKMREEVMAEVEKEKERIKAENPDVAPENLPKPDMKAIADKVRAAHKDEVKAIVTKLVDEDIAHSEKLLAIKKQTRETVIDAAAEKMGQMSDRMREGTNGREGGMRGNRGDGQGNPEGREQMKEKIREKVRERMVEKMRERGKNRPAQPAE